MPTLPPLRPRDRPGGVVAVVASGLLLGLSFPPFPFPFLAGFALVPLLLRWDCASSGRLFLLEVYGAFLITFGVAFSWPLFHALRQTALLSLGGLLLLPLLMGLPVAAAVPVRRRLGRGPGLAALAAFYLVMEMLLSRGPFAFPWSLLGHTQAEAFPLNQVAAWTGVAGLTLWVLLVNAAAFLALRAPMRLQRRAGAGAAALLIVLPLLAGLWRPGTRSVPAEALAVGLVQPAVPPLAWADVHDATRVDLLLHLSDSLLAASRPRPALVAWPETALPVPRDAAERARLHARLARWAQSRSTALLAGGIAPLGAGRAPEAYANRALLFLPGGTSAATLTPATYDKQVLVPFAERVPFVDRLPWLRAFAIPAGGVEGYRPGTQPPVLSLGETAFGILICFESVFGNYARHAVEQGATFVVTLTQDGWWGRTAGYRQHLAFSRLRAIELRRAVAQVAVTGTTALILPDGATAFETRWMERTARVATIPLRTETTVYARYGDWLSWLALAAAVLLSLHGLTPTRCPQRHHAPFRSTGSSPDA